MMKMNKAYQHDADGYYLGEFQYPGYLLPHNCVAKQPDIVEGYIPHWTGKKWEQVENHKGDEGYLGGQLTKITEYGPYPDGWSTTPPAPTAEEAKEARKAKIIAELAELDTKESRPVQAVTTAIALGEKPSEEDIAKLKEYEAKKTELRAELAAL